MSDTQIIAELWDREKDYAEVWRWFARHGITNRPYEIFPAFGVFAIAPDTKVRLAWWGCYLDNSTGVAWLGECVTNPEVKSRRLLSAGLYRCLDAILNELKEQKRFIVNYTLHTKSMRRTMQVFGFKTTMSNVSVMARNI